MVDDGPTQWIEQLAEGNQQAAQRIWERYREQLLRVARRKLQADGRRMADEEDAALSAFASFCRAAAEGRFSKLSDRDDLWKLLVTITSRKAVAQMRYQYRLKRGGGAVRGESVFLERGDSDRPGGLDGVAAPEPTPEFAALMAEQCEVPPCRTSRRFTAPSRGDEGGVSQQSGNRSIFGMLPGHCRAEAGADSR